MGSPGHQAGAASDLLHRPVVQMAGDRDDVEDEQQDAEQLWHSAILDRRYRGAAPAKAPETLFVLTQARRLHLYHAERPRHCEESQHGMQGWGLTAYSLSPLAVPTMKVMA